MRLCSNRKRCKWLKEGDADTTFFYRLACMGNRVNKIHSLRDGEDIIQDEKSIHNHIFKHFKALFGQKNNFRTGMKDRARYPSVDWRNNLGRMNLKRWFGSWDQVKPQDQTDFHYS